MAPRQYEPTVEEGLEEYYMEQAEADLSPEAEEDIWAGEPKPTTVVRVDGLAHPNLASPAQESKG